jgi:hypothetical protein
MSAREHGCRLPYIGEGFRRTGVDGVLSPL